MSRKTPPHENEAVADYWLKHYIDKHCSLCGNTGTIDTRETAITPAGLRVGRLNFCICPNGQAMRALSHIPAEFVNIGRKQ
jgi:hypothetical protein